MGLFYTALERADKIAAASPAAPAPAAESDPLAPVTTWQEAEARDLAGFPLFDPAPAASAVEETASRPAAQLDAAALGLAVNQAGIGNEQYRILRTRVLEALRGHGRRCLLITSAGGGEGKTTVAANLAVNCSGLKEERVLLIDADLRRAGLSACLAPAPRGGLRSYLRDRETAWEAALMDVNPWLTLLPTEIESQDAAELLASQRMATLIQEAQTRFDLVLFDGAPVMPVVDSRILARLLGASLLVVRAGEAAVEAVQQAAELLQPTLLGGVLNGARKKTHAKYGYPYAAPTVVAPAAAAAEAKP